MLTIKNIDELFNWQIRSNGGHVVIFTSIDTTPEKYTITCEIVIGGMTTESILNIYRHSLEVSFAGQYAFNNPNFQSAYSFSNSVGKRLFDRGSYRIERN